MHRRIGAGDLIDAALRWPGVLSAGHDTTAEGFRDLLLEARVAERLAARAKLLGAYPRLSKAEPDRRASGYRSNA
jgi:hypothetical protein